MLDKSATDLTYDEFPYPSMTIQETHPDRIAAVARFHGLETESPKSCRVLELGCGNGSNLTWLASSLPDSEFIGIDLSQNHITEARETLGILGLTNTAFHQQDVLEIGEQSYDKFDYIIAHGLFSWVPEAVSERILELYGKLLNPNGVGYISYNVLPGFHLRKIMREAMQFHVRNTSGTFEIVKKARTFAQFLSENTIHTPLYHQLIESEFNEMIDRDDSNIYHDDLSTLNNPFYFSDFVGRAAKHQLQFLSEAGRPTSLPRDLPPEVLKFIENNSENLIESEQYIDYFQCTRFRKTLLCRNNVILDREFKPNAIKQFFISSSLRPDSGAIAVENQKTEKFTTNSGASFETDHLLTKAVLACFATNESHEISFEELVNRSIDDLSTKGFSTDSWEKELETTISLLIQLYVNRMIRFHVCSSSALNYLPEKPKVSDFARLQAQKGERVPTSHGANILLSDDFTKELFTLLTGDKTRSELIAALVPKLYPVKETDIDIEDFRERISKTLDEALDQLVRFGLFV